MKRFYLTTSKKYVILLLVIGVAVFVCPKQAMSRTWSANRISYDRPKVAFFCEDIMAFKKGERPWNKGSKLTTEHCDNLSKSHIGQEAWNKGKKYSMGENYISPCKGKTLKKPYGFSKTMRRINPPFGRKKDGRGYIYIYMPDYPHSRKVPPNYGYILEHIFIMGEEIGRKIETKKGECVHHLNGDKGDNRKENLVFCGSVKDHNRLHDKMEKFVNKLILDGEVCYDREKKEFCFRRDS